MVETDSATVAFQRHIIERPRLMRLLEGAKERVILLTAPAGYGKTTLARQWSQRRPNVVWCSCTSASSDPAALALTIAREIEGFAPDDARRIRTFLRATQAEINVVALSDRIAGGTRAWPEGTWLFVDDYHLIPEPSGGASLVQTITDAAPLPVMIASRVRPEWASRRVLYGDALELDASVLTMNEDEVGQVLTKRKSRDVAWFSSSVGGWPAIVGLASLTTADLPEHWAGEMHNYFAKEVFALLSPEAQKGILKLALAPQVSRAALDVLLEAGSSRVLQEGMRQAFVTPTGSDSYVIHPLLLDFLRKHEDYPRDNDAAVDELLERLLADNSFDEAFDLVRVHASSARLRALLRLGIDDLLHSGRTRTLSDWLALARATRLVDPVVEFASSHVAFRAGEHLRAQDLARQAARAVRDTDPFAARIVLQAGTAAYFTDDIASAKASFARARAVATSESDIRETVWQEFTVASHLCDPDARLLLQQYEGVSDGGVAHQVRLATGRISLACSFGGLSETLAAIGDASALLRGCDDAMIAVSFLTTLGAACAMNGRYLRAAAAAKEAAALAQTHDLAFANLQTTVVRGNAEIGLRRYSHTAVLLDRLERAAHQLGDVWVETIGLGLRARLYAVHSPDLPLTEPSIAGQTNATAHGTYVASLALLAIARGQWDQALRLADESAGISPAIEVRVLANIVAAAALIAKDVPGAGSALANALTEAHVTGNLNAAVLTYRAFPRLLRHAGGGKTPQWLRDVLVAAGDSDLAKGEGVELPPTGGRRKLSQRELQVLRLVSEGLTNPEIGERLFITAGTVKAHLQHAYEKLGVKTRTEAALRAVAEDEFLGDL